MTSAKPAGVYTIQSHVLYADLSLSNTNNIKNFVFDIPNGILTQYLDYQFYANRIPASTVTFDANFSSFVGNSTLLDVQPKYTADG